MSSVSASPRTPSVPKRSTRRRRVRYRFEYCGALRAFLRPYLRRSFSRASRARSPAFFSTGRGVGIERDQRAGDAEADGAGLAAHAAAAERGVDVVDLFGLREPQRLLGDDLVREDREVRRERRARSPRSCRCRGAARTRATASLRRPVVWMRGLLTRAVLWRDHRALARAAARSGSGAVDRLLRLVRMRRAAVDLQLAQHLPAERALRQHAAHRELHDLLGVAREQVLEALAADAARVAGVAVVRLLRSPCAGRSRASTRSTTTTWSPVSTCGAQIGLCLPRSSVAISVARRPRIAPSASITCHCRVMSAALGRERAHGSSLVRSGTADGVRRPAARTRARGDRSANETG